MGGGGGEALSSVMIVHKVELYCVTHDISHLVLSLDVGMDKLNVNHNSRKTVSIYLELTSVWPVNKQNFCAEGEVCLCIVSLFNWVGHRLGCNGLKALWICGEKNLTCV